jgi:hypothetical protein
MRSTIVPMRPSRIEVKAATAPGMKAGAVADVAADDQANSRLVGVVAGWVNLPKPPLPR